jgi:hypothetical protein
VVAAVVVKVAVVLAVVVLPARVAVSSISSSGTKRYGLAGFTENGQ